MLKPPVKSISKERKDEEVKYIIPINCDVYNSKKKTGGGIGMNVGGRVVVKLIQEWHRLAKERTYTESERRMMTQTFEEWKMDPETCSDLPMSVFNDENASKLAYAAWHARDAELAEKDRRIAELERQIDAARNVAKAILNVKDIDEGYLHSETCRLRNQVATLEARIAAGLALADKWSKWTELDAKATISDIDEPDEDGEIHIGCYTHGSRCTCAYELRTALSEPAAERGPGDKP